MVTYRAPFSHWAGYTFADLAGFTFAHMVEPSRCLTLAADIVLAPVTDNSPRQNHIITPQLIAIANQLAYVMDLNYKMGLLKRIEFVTGNDLDEIWGQVYGQRRRYGEGDDEYRKRLQVYLLQVAGSGTKAAIEEIISIICEFPNSCRVDTYWPGYCRIYITNAYARLKARDRLDLINLVLPNTIAAGVDYRLYIPYVDLSADIVLCGPAYTNLMADEALQGQANRTIDASIFLASRHDESIAADVVLAAINFVNLPVSIAIQGEVRGSLDANIALQGQVSKPLTADEALQGQVETTFAAYERLYADVRTDLDADIVLQANRLRPIEARMKLVTV